MSSGTQGATKIIKPGYHLRPTYDLHGLRRRRRNDHRGEVVSELPLTRLIDMFSILVIYLLMNFSATGEIFFMNKDLPLPNAMRTNPLETGPLISIVGDTFVLDVPPEYQGTGAIEDSSLSLKAIVDQLNTYHARALENEIPSGNRINVQASEDAPIGLIKRAMTAAVSSGWTNINFVVKKTKAE
jgi:biopolymer transport protein ExbD